MMMAHDKTPDRPELSTAAVGALRSALESFLAGSSPDSVQPALKRVAEEARAKHIHAEQLLILLKDIWFALPQVHNAQASEEQSRLLQRVVSMCIRAYYETPPSR